MDYIVCAMNVQGFITLDILEDITSEGCERNITFEFERFIV